MQHLEFDLPGEIKTARDAPVQSQYLGGPGAAERQRTDVEQLQTLLHPRRRRRRQSRQARRQNIDHSSSNAWLGSVSQSMDSCHCDVLPTIASCDKILQRSAGWSHSTVSADNVCRTTTSKVRHGLSELHIRTDCVRQTACDEQRANIMSKVDGTCSQNRHRKCGKKVGETAKKSSILCVSDLTLAAVWLPSVAACVVDYW